MHPQSKGTAPPVRGSAPTTGSQYKCDLKNNSSVSPSAQRKGHPVRATATTTGSRLLAENVTRKTTVLHPLPKGRVTQQEQGQQLPQQLQSVTMLACLVVLLSCFRHSVLGEKVVHVTASPHMYIPSCTQVSCITGLFSNCILSTNFADGIHLVNKYSSSKAECNPNMGL